MKQLVDYKENIHKCSKCGLCQAECPIYKITGNDCAVSRGHFNMLRGVIDGDLKFSKIISRYLDLCLNCNVCAKFCPSGIDILDVVATAKSEYLKKHLLKKIFIRLKNFFLFSLLPNIISFFYRSKKSKAFSKKIFYFGGCSSKVKTTNSITKLLNKCDIEVINPNFSCCGITSYINGDFEIFEKNIDDFVRRIKKYDINEIVVSCASCEKALKSYINLTQSDSNKQVLSGLKIKNIYEYICAENLRFDLKKPVKITYHKPCNLDNFENIKWLLLNTNNLEYVEMQAYDKCCGLNLLTNFSQREIVSEISKFKYDNIVNANVKIVATSCFGCEIALNSYSKGKYKTIDLLDLLADYS